jgi:hypothetical protein
MTHPLAALRQIIAPPAKPCGIVVQAGQGVAVVATREGRQAFPCRGVLAPGDSVRIDNGAAVKVEPAAESYPV